MDTSYHTRLSFALWNRLSYLGLLFFANGKSFLRISKRGRQAALTARTIKSPHSFSLAIALSLFDIKVTSISVYKAHIIYEALAAENFKQLTQPPCSKKHRGFPESPRVSPSRSVSAVRAPISLFKLSPPQAFTMNVRK